MKKLLVLLLSIVSININTLHACDCMITFNAECPITENEQNEMKRPLEKLIFGDHKPAITWEQISATPRDYVMVKRDPYYRVLRSTLDCIDQRIAAVKDNISKLELAANRFSWLKFIGNNILVRLGMDRWNAMYNAQWDNHANALNSLQGTKNRLLRSHNRYSDQYLAKILTKTRYNQDGSIHTIKDWENNADNSGIVYIHKNVVLPFDIVKNILFFNGEQKISIPERDIATCYQWGKISERNLSSGGNHRAERLQFLMLKGDHTPIILDKTMGHVIADHEHWNELYQKDWVRFTPGQEIHPVYAPCVPCFANWATRYGPHVRILSKIARKSYNPTDHGTKVYFMFPGEEKMVRVKVNGNVFNQRVVYDKSKKGEGITWTLASNAEAFIINGNTVNKMKMSGF